jgi:cell division protein FtsB
MAIRKREEDGLHDKKMMWLLGAVVALFFLLWILFAPGRGFFHYLKLHREIVALTEENSRLEAKNVELAEDIKKLQSDKAYLEKIAREKHGLLKKDEMVFDFEKPEKKK